MADVEEFLTKEEMVGASAYIFSFHFPSLFAGRPWPGAGAGEDIERLF